MLLELIEIDKPKTIGEKVAEFLAKPPQPILRFYGGISTEADRQGRQILFSVRNGVPLPLLYGVYVEAKYDSLTDYIERTDHIGGFCTDNWRLEFDNNLPAQVQIRLGIVPFEILTDKAEFAIQGS